MHYPVTCEWGWSLALIFTLQMHEGFKELREKNQIIFERIR